MKYFSVNNGIVVSVRSTPHQEYPFSTIDDTISPGWTYINGVLDGTNVKKINLINAIDAKTRLGISLGYTRNGKQFSASDNHQTWALGILVGIQAGVDHTGINVPTIDNTDSHTIVDNTDAAAQAMACINYVKGWLATGSALKKQATEDNADFDAIEAANNARS
jgi:hypothetical protein